MNTHLESAARDAIGEQAAHWLCVLTCGDADERKAFVKWLKKSPHHVEEFLLLSAVCKGLAGAEPADQDGIDRLLVDALHPTLTNIVPLPAVNDVGRTSPPPIPVKRGAMRWTGVAAGVCLAILGALWATPWVSSKLNTYATAVGEQRTVRLTDGSMVYMNAQSRCRVNYSAAARDIDLIEGEAIFKVEKATQRPFRVHARTLTIQALGTQFNVYRHAEGSTVVSVLEGAVRISKETPPAPNVGPRSTASVQLAVGEEVALAVDGAITKRTHADLSRTTAWRQRRLVFRENRLEDIAAEFARYSPRRIVVIDEAARNKRITGTFDADDPQSLILFIQQLDGFAVETTAEEFIVRWR